MLTIRSTPLGFGPDVPLLRLRPAGHGAPDRVFLLDGSGLVAWGTAHRIEVGVGAERFPHALRELRSFFDAADVIDDVRAPRSGPIAVGSFAFAEDDPASVLVIPEIAVARHDGRTWVTSIGDTVPDVGLSDATDGTSVPPDRIRFGGSTVDDLTWLGSVDGILRRIEDAEVEKVVLARDQQVWSRTPIDLPALVSALAGSFSGCATFRVDGLVGASPEVLVDCRDGRITSRVLAGTTRRDPDPSADGRLGRELLMSDKDRREHALAVTSVREALSAVATGLGDAVEPSILQLSNVQHLMTDLTGDLMTPLDSLEIAGILHPTAAVAGSPREAAVRVISELEGMSRERYAGPVGWTSWSGDGTWAIALRCGMFDGSRGRLFAGAGIVEGSLPEAELSETWLKLQAMRGTLQGLRPKGPGR